MQAPRFTHNFRQANKHTHTSYSKHTHISCAQTDSGSIVLIQVGLKTLTKVVHMNVSQGYI